MKNVLVPMAAQPRVPKYGVTEQKKAELDRLTLEVIDAQNSVNTYQAMVDSLTAKLANFEGYLSLADTNRTSALNNKNMMIGVVNAAGDLLNNSNIAYDEMTEADALTNKLAADIKDVIDKLIYASEVIEKLSNLIVRSKALNPLISDDLVSMITQAGTDANNAVALTLVALDSVFTAQASNSEAQAAAALERLQADAFLHILTTDDVKEITQQKKTKKGKKSSTTLTITIDCLETLLDNAYTRADQIYQHEYDAVTIVTDQLNDANAKLDAATINLNSLEAELAAANAAALAS